MLLGPGTAGPAFGRLHFVCSFKISASKWLTVVPCKGIGPSLAQLPSNGLPFTKLRRPLVLMHAWDSSALATVLLNYAVSEHLQSQALHRVLVKLEHLVGNF